MEFEAEPEVLWGGPAVHAFVMKLTGEADLTLGRFYQRAAAGKYPIRKIGTTITATPSELRESLTGCPERRGLGATTAPTPIPQHPEEVA